MPTTDEQLTMTFEGISASHWDWVHRLIADVKEQEQREHLVTLWAQWRMAVRFFRQAEFILMRNKKPGSIDFRFHRACLAGLMSIGEFLLLHIAETGNQDDLRKLGFSKEDAEASLQTLRLNWEEWHSDVNTERLAELQAKLAVLNGAASTH